MNGWRGLRRAAVCLLGMLAACPPALALAQAQHVTEAGRLLLPAVRGGMPPPAPVMDERYLPATGWRTVPLPHYCPVAVCCRHRWWCRRCRCWRWSRSACRCCPCRRFVTMGLQMLVQVGHAIDPAAVLGAPVADAERAA